MSGAMDRGCGATGHLVPVQNTGGNYFFNLYQNILVGSLTVQPIYTRVLRCHRCDRRTMYILFCGDNVYDREKAFPF